MEIILNLGVFITALLHVWFFVLETFLWQTSFGRKTFKTEREFAKKTAPLAANQGLYNAFLAAGLFWSLCTSFPEALHLKVFFLSCVVVAGIFGAATVNLKILFVQALPAALTLIFLVCITLI